MVMSKVGPIVAAVAAAALIALLGYGLINGGDGNTIDDAVKSGEQPEAPSRTLPRIGPSGPTSLAELRGKPVILNFWASWCGPCKDEAPLLENAQKRLQAMGGTVLGVTYRDATPDAKKFIAEQKITYPNLRDVDGKLAEDYGTNKLPETFVIDADGKIVAVSRGQVSEKFMQNALAQLEAS